MEALLRALELFASGLMILDRKVIKLSEHFFIDVEYPFADPLKELFEKQEGIVQKSEDFMTN